MLIKPTDLMKSWKILRNKTSLVIGVNFYFYLFGFFSSQHVGVAKVSTGGSAVRKFQIF